MTVTEEERKRAIDRSRRMYQTDLQSNLATAEDRGRRIGFMDGLIIGRVKGEAKQTREIALYLMSIGMPYDQIEQVTGLSSDDLVLLRQRTGANKLSVTEEERGRAIDCNREMYQTDMQSNFATVENRGRRIGFMDGLAISRVEDEAKQTREIALYLMSISVSYDQIEQITGLSSDDLVSLRQRMGVNKLTVTEEERERAIDRSRRMYQTDMQSNLATVEDRGRRIGFMEGLAKSRAENREKGRAEGMAEGEAIRTREIALNLMSIGMPYDQIEQVTGLSSDDLDLLRKKNGANNGIDGL